MQQDMVFDEDSLASSHDEQAASEVTCTDYLKQYEVDNVSHESDDVPHENIGSSSASSLNAEALLFPLKTSLTLTCGK